MNKSLFFDIQLGASGDMLLGTLFDICLDKNELISLVSSLGLSNWKIEPHKTIKYYIEGTLANVSCKDNAHGRNLNDIEKIISNSKLHENIKTNIMSIFTKLAHAEAKVHGKNVSEIHFHEIGAIDSIIDISSFCIAIYILQIKDIYYNEFPFGTGTIKSSHGEIPVPVPAVVELLKNHKSRFTDKSMELVTPTAAAILTTLGKQIQHFDFTIIKSGIGFGTRDYPFPSYTRGFLIKPSEQQRSEIIQQLECNIDDMNPQLYPNIIELLLNAGALDAYTMSISMKKGRTGTLLTVIANTDNIANLKKIIYNNTTTLGLRIFNINREKLIRKYEEVTVSNQQIRIKIGYYNNNIVNIQPEFEDCKTAAERLNLPIKEIISEAICKYKNNEKK